MTKKQLRESIKDPIILNMFNVCDKLGIKYRLINQTSRWQYFELTYKGHIEYTKNAILGRNTDKLITTVTDNKDLVKTVLKKNKIKVPIGFTAEDFKEIRKKMRTQKLKFPIVVKPELTNQGTGVIAGIKNEKALKEGIAEIKKIKRSEKTIIVEEYFPGRDFRLLFLKGKFLACTERVHPHVVGDGQKNVRTLIEEQIKSNPNSKFKYDWEARRCLKVQKIKLTTILPKDTEIRLKEKANICTGGISIDRTAKVAPKFKKIAKKCLGEFGIVFGGVDVMTSDIGNENADYRVIEVNTNPDYIFHDKPDIGKSHNVTEQALKYIFKI